MISERHPLTILVIEDDEDAREVLVEVLAAEGHVVQGAADGEEGLARAFALRPRVALIDVGLPGIDGFEVARRLRVSAACQGMFLIALTGHGTASDRAHAIAAGFDLHMVKPVSPTDLQRALAAAETQALSPGIE